MQSEAVCSLNHETKIPFALTHIPTFEKFTPTYTTIGDSQLCFLRFDSMMSTMCLLDGGTHYYWEAHRILQ